MDPRPIIEDHEVSSASKTHLAGANSIRASLAGQRAQFATATNVAMAGTKSRRPLAAERGHADEPASQRDPTADVLRVR